MSALMRTTCRRCNTLQLTRNMSNASADNKSDVSRRALKRVRSLENIDKCLMTPKYTVRLMRVSGPFVPVTLDVLNGRLYL